MPETTRSITTGLVTQTFERLSIEELIASRCLKSMIERSKAVPVFLIWVSKTAWTTQCGGEQLRSAYTLN